MIQIENLKTKLDYIRKTVLKLYDSLNRRTQSLNKCIRSAGINHIIM